MKLTWLLVWAYLKRWFKLITATLSTTTAQASLIIALGVIAISAKLIFSSLQTSTISEGVVGLYQGNELPEVITNLLSSPLIKIDKSGLPQPNLAKSIGVNPEGTVYTLTLRKNLYWNDGSLVKAADIAFDLPNVEINFPNDKTVEFHLAEAFSPFPTLLTKPIFKKGSSVGIGNYQLLSAEKNQGFLVRLKLKPLKADLPQLVVRFYQDEKTLKTAFEIGEIQSMVDVTDIAGISKEGRVKSKQLEVNKRLVAIFFNTKDNILSDKNLRLALSLATPNLDPEVKAKGPIPPSSWVYNDKTKDLSFNQDGAKAQLEKAHLDKASPIVLTATPNLAAVGEKVITEWKKLGLNAVLRVESGVPQSFQALLITQLIPSDPDQYGLWHSTQGKTNISQYSSPRVDKDLEEGRKLLDKDKRKESYQDFQRIILDDSPADFLYFPKLNIVYRTKVENQLNKVLNLQFPN